MQTVVTRVTNLLREWVSARRESRRVERAKLETLTKIEQHLAVLAGQHIDDEALRRRLALIEERLAERTDA
jgi:hypothetical protein